MYDMGILLIKVGALHVTERCHYNLYLDGDVWVTSTATISYVTNSSTMVLIFISHLTTAV